LASCWPPHLQIWKKVVINNALVANALFVWKMFGSCAREWIPLQVVNTCSNDNILSNS